MVVVAPKPETSGAPQEAPKPEAKAAPKKTGKK